MSRDTRPNEGRNTPTRRRVLRTIGATAAVPVVGSGATSGERGDTELAGLQIEAGDPCEWERTDDARLPFDTDGYGGWGGHESLGTDPGLDRYPVVFAHGNSRDACDFLDHAEYLVERGFGGDALWSITFGREGSTHEEMRDQLDGFVARIREYTGVDRVQVVGHSLGVTGLRYWLDGLENYPERYDRVETVVGLAGANRGTWTCGPGCREGPGNTRVCAFISHSCADTPGEPLYELNHPDATPNDDTIDYHTVRGCDDRFFLLRPESPTLDGAENVELATDHDGVRTEEATKRLLAEWLSTPLSSSSSPQSPRY